MKRLALVAAPLMLAACTTMHEDRRTLTNWDLDLIKGVGKAKPKQPTDRNDWDGWANPMINYVLVEPVAICMLPVAWLGDTLIVNPINGFEKAELQVYNRRFSQDDTMGVSESGVRNEQLAPGVAPWIVGDVLAWPEFAAHWLWNSTYPTAPVCRDDWNRYWNEHHEQSTQ